MSVVNKGPVAVGKRKSVTPVPSKKTSGQKNESCEIRYPQAGKNKRHNKHQFVCSVSFLFFVDIFIILWYFNIQILLRMIVYLV